MGIENGTRNADGINASTALGRLVEPSEMASAIAFLISDRASAITGSVLPVDAGFLAASPQAIFGGPRPAMNNGGKQS
jgi:NAD(P)-dependent dehydrogenase (short-subunit alcohol dehydrogenase family)